MEAIFQKEDPSLDRLRHCIREIEETPEINIKGVESLIRKNVLCYEVRGGLYKKVADYADEIGRSREERRENSFDNRKGALMKLQRIISEYELRRRE